MAAEVAAGGCFEQWQRDAFFGAAEEVQESADLMGSLYRTWIRDSNDGVSSEDLDELLRELRTALGTAKWQLEQFERAVGLSHGKYLSDESTIARRRQFVLAIEDQIAIVEKAVNGAFIEDGKQGFSWVRLDDEERDDFVAFLSVPLHLSQEARNRDTNYRKNSSPKKTSEVAMKDHGDVVTSSRNARHGVEVAPGEVSNGEVTLYDQMQQFSDQRKTLNSEDNDDWRIRIADDKGEDQKLDRNRQEASSWSSSAVLLLRRMESMAKLRWFRSSWCKVKSEENLQFRHDVPTYLDSNGVTSLAQRFSGLTERSRSCFNSWKESSSKFQLSGRNGQHIQAPNTLFGHSLRITILLLLSIILIVSFVLNAA